MIPHKCAVKHYPPETYGDCFSSLHRVPTVAYSNINDVPHFYRDGDDIRGQCEEFKDWLKNRHVQNCDHFTWECPEQLRLLISLK